jgi:hypothetical protein
LQLQKQVLIQAAADASNKNGYQLAFLQFGEFASFMLPFWVAATHMIMVFYHAF